MEEHSVKFKDNSYNLSGSPLFEGAAAPPFSAFNSDFSELAISEFKGDIILIISLPSVNAFPAQNLVPFLKEAGKSAEGVRIMAISADLPFTLEKFSLDSDCGPILFVSDHRLFDFARKYGFYSEQLHFSAGGIVVIDQDGIIQYIHYCRDMEKEPDYTSALDALQSLAYIPELLDSNFKKKEM